MPGIDLRLLASFVALADELHFGRAAERLHLGQPALSQQITRLERQLSVTLFERTTRDVRLAPAGHAFLAGARGAIQLVQQASQDARHAGTQRRAVRIGIDIDAPETMTRRVRRFGGTRADLQVRVSVQQQDDLLRQLVDGQQDLVIGWTAPPGEENGLGWAPLITLELHGVIARSDPLADLGALPRDALSRHRVVMYEPTRETRPFYDFFLAAFSIDGAPPVVAHIPVFDDAQTAMMDMVQAGGGFTLCLPGSLEANSHPGLINLPFDPPVHAEVVAMWRRHQEPQVLGELLAWFR